MSKTRFAILWRNQSQKDQATIMTLTYADGEVRTYTKDKVDWRVGDFEFVQTKAEAVEKLSKANGKQFAVPVSIAQLLILDTIFSKD